MEYNNELKDFELYKYMEQADKKPYAYAFIKGSGAYPNILGIVLFYEDNGGTWVHVEVKGLPNYKHGVPGEQPIGPHGFHIHTGSACEPMDTTMPFAKTMGHY